MYCVRGIIMVDCLLYVECFCICTCVFVFFFQAEDGIRNFCLVRGLGDGDKKKNLGATKTMKNKLKSLGAREGW